MADPFAQLSRLIANLESIGDDGVAQVSDALEPAVQAVLESEYTEGKGPNGESWAVKADGTPSHLQKSGAMRSGSKAIRGVSGVSVRIPKPGGFHQSGTKRMSARKLVPDGEPLTGDWAKAAETAAHGVIVEKLLK